MTNPTFEWAKTSTPQTPAQAGNNPTFDWAKPTSTPEQKQEGFLSYLANIGKNWFKVDGVQNALEMQDKFGVKPDFDLEQQMIAEQVQKAKQTGSGAGIAAKDFANMFTKTFQNVGQQWDKLKELSGGAAASLKHPLDASGQLLKAFVSPIGDMMDLNSGISLSGDDIHALTPEEKAARIKNVVGMAAMMATGTGIAKGLSIGDRALKASLALGEASGLSTDALLGASRLTAKGALAKTLLSNTAVTVGSGLTYGMVAHANEGDQLAEAIMNGVVMAPLGVAFEMLRVGKGTRDKLSTAAAAGELAKVRQLQDIYGSSIRGITQNIDALSNADDLASAVLQGQIGLKPNDVIQIPSVNPERLAALDAKLPDGYRSVMHVDKDGVGSLLVYDENIKLTGSLGMNVTSLEKIFDDKRIGYKDKQALMGEDTYALFKQKANDGETFDISYLKNQQPYVIDRKLLNKYPFLEEYSHKIDEQFFQQYGLIKSSRVSYGGSSEWKIINSIGDKIEIQNIHNKSFDIVKPEELRNLTTIDIPKEQLTNRLYQEWRTQANQTAPSPIVGMQDELSKLSDQMKGATPEQRTSLEKQAALIERQIDIQRAKEADPIGFDEIPPMDDQSLLDRVPEPDRNYTQELSDFLSGKGFAPDDVTSLVREFGARLTKEAHASEFDPGEAKFYEDADTQFRDLRAEQSLGKIKSIDDLVSAANTNGMYILDEGAGHISIKDIESKKTLLRSSNLNEAINFINKSGQANGINLDSGNLVSGATAAKGRLIAPQIDLDPTKEFYKATGKLENLIHTFNLSSFGFWNTPNRQLFVALDSKYGTNLFSSVFDKLQTAKRTSNGHMRAYLEKLQGIDKIVGKLDKGTRELIGRWMETMTPDEIIHGYGSRKFTQFEIDMGRKLGKSDVDIENVFNYMSDLRELDKEFPNRDVSQKQAQQYAQRQAATKEAYGIDNNHQEVADIFNQIKGMNVKEASLGFIVRLARSIKNGEVSRSEFASKNKMSLDMLRAGNSLEQMYRDLAPVFGISPEQRLSGYMTHARIASKGNFGETLEQHFSGDVKTRQFYAKMARTGEISAYETDPIRAMLRYIKAGFDAKHLSESIASAQNSLNAEIKKMPFPAQAQARAIGDKYISDIKGWLSAGDQATEAAVGEMLGRFGVSTEINVKRNVVNAISATVPAATQGMRVVAGARDFATGMQMYGARFGLNRMRNMVEMGAKGMVGETRHEMERLGIINTLSPVTISDATEAATSSLAVAGRAATKTLDKATHAMFRLSGQQDVYALMHVGAYLETQARASTELLKLSRGEQKWNAVRKGLKLDTYDLPVAQEFKNRVQNQDYAGAARFLAQQTGYETIGVYGLANHPYGWGTNIGRIAGQFGSWPMWYARAVGRLATRGTLAQRTAGMARLVGLNQATMAAGAAVGLNLSNWSILNGITYTGGPGVDAARAVLQSVGGYGYEQQEGIRKLRKYLPFDPFVPDGEGGLSFEPSQGHANVRQLYIPGSFFVNDLINAADQAAQGNPGAAAAQFLGFKPKQQQ